jgi:hypothetical protein
VLYGCVPGTDSDGATDTFVNYTTQVGGGLWIGEEVIHGFTLKEDVLLLLAKGTGSTSK